MAKTEEQKLAEAVRERAGCATCGGTGWISFPKHGGPHAGPGDCPDCAGGEGDDPRPPDPYDGDRLCKACRYGTCLDHPKDEDL